ncbi:MAG: hypothetical protein GY870_18630 [archaeon]|nr:hypothetical protein [archaeon]
MVEPFWPFPINSFLLFLGEEILPLKISNFIQLIGLPIGIFCWVCVITEMIFKKRQKIILILSGIYCTIYELIFIPSIIIYSSIEENELVFGIMTFYGISFFIITITTGIRFAWENIKAENPINKIKGKFMFYGFIFYAIATISVWIHLFELISSILFLFSGTFLYFGFILPSWIKKRFL